RFVIVLGIDRGDDTRLLAERRLRARAWPPCEGGDGRTGPQRLPEDSGTRLNVGTGAGVDERLAGPQDCRLVRAAHLADPLDVVGVKDVRVAADVLLVVDGADDAKSP